MNFVVFNGSPAGANGNTSVIVEAFLAGAKRAGADTEQVFLIDRTIGHCRGCFACWFQTPGACVLEDDMAELLEKYCAADVVCYATPVYTWNVTAALKNFVDRLTPLRSPRMVNSGDRFDLPESQPKTQRFAVIANCGFPGDANFDIMRAVFSPCNPVLEIYRNCGRILKSGDAKIREVVGKYLRVVEQAGYELATQDCASDATREALGMQLMSAQDYVNYIGM